MARLLKENAFVYDYKVLNDGRHGLVRVYLKYYEGEPVIRHIVRVSRPGRRRYVGVDGYPAGAWGPGNGGDVHLARIAFRPRCARRAGGW